MRSRSRRRWPRFAAPGAPAEAELVSRETQSTLGLLTGTVLMGIALASTFSLVFAWAYGRVGAFGAPAVAALLDARRLPRDHPRALDQVPGDAARRRQPGHDRQTHPAVRRDDRDLRAGDGRGRAPVAAAFAAAGLVERGSLVAAGAVFVVVIAVAELILPAVNEIPNGFPADVLWQYRLASIGMNAVLWSAIGLGFGVLAERVLAPSRAASHAAGPAAAPTA